MSRQAVRVSMCVRWISCKPNPTTSMLSSRQRLRYYPAYHPSLKNSAVRCASICDGHDISSKLTPTSLLFRDCTNSHRMYCSTTQDPEFKAFYHLPYIVPMRVFSRLKLAQTVLTVSLVPAFHVGEFYGIAFGVDKSLFLSLSVLALLMLYAMGEFFRRLVGIMYLSRDQTRVKLSHLTFWGNRNDLFVPVSDIVPLRDCAEDKDVINKLRRYSTNQFLLISTKYGRILNPELFGVVFGELRSAKGNGR